MHKTESLNVNYIFAKLRETRLELEGGAVLNEFFTYLSLHGCLYVDNFISLEAVPATNKVFPQMSEVEVLNLVKDLLGEDKDLDTFILDNVKSPEKREERIKRLKKYSKSFSYKHWEKVK